MNEEIIAERAIVEIRPADRPDVYWSEFKSAAGGS
jgi:hypothetical protein